MLYLPREDGQGLVEYALILVLVAVVVIVILALLGPAVGNVFSNIVQNI
jgi:pilus assembly protein Flp/PilA